MSICSHAGIDWVNERVKGLNFRDPATRFTRDMTRRLKLTKKISTTRAPDPETQTALRYSQGESRQLAFGERCGD